MTLFRSSRGREPVTVEHTVAPRDVDATIERGRKPLEPPVPVIPGRAS